MQRLCLSTVQWHVLERGSSKASVAAVAAGTRETGKVEEHCLVGKECQQGEGAMNQLPEGVPAGGGGYEPAAGMQNGELSGAAERSNVVTAASWGEGGCEANAGMQNGGLSGAAERSLLPG